MSKDIRNEGMWGEVDRNREFLKCPDLNKITRLSDQEKKLPQPPLSKAAKGEIIELSADFGDAVTVDSYKELLDIRRSERVYDKDAVMTRQQLAFLLWSTQGVQEIKGDNYCTLRPAPSGGARHPFETYFIARRVEGLKPGIYHYLPLEDIGEKRVVIEFTAELPDDSFTTAMLAGQGWESNASIVILYTCVAYRAEWRYCDFAHRVVLIDVGHVGQNLMLSAASLGLGSCCIAAFDQKLCDEALQLDGYEESTIYVCTAGKVK